MNQSQNINMHNARGFRSQAVPTHYFSEYIVRTCSARRRTHEQPVVRNALLSSNFRLRKVCVQRWIHKPRPQRRPPNTRRSQMRIIATVTAVRYHMRPEISHLCRESCESVCVRDIGGMYAVVDHVCVLSDYQLPHSWSIACARCRL